MLRSSGNPGRSVVLWLTLAACTGGMGLPGGNEDVHLASALTLILPEGGEAAAGTLTAKQMNGAICEAERVLSTPPLGNQDFLGEYFEPIHYDPGHQISAFSQLPTDRVGTAADNGAGYFLGRYASEQAPPGSTYFGLRLYQMEWSTNELVPVRGWAFPAPGVPVPEHRVPTHPKRGPIVYHTIAADPAGTTIFDDVVVRNAYDPTVALYRGEMWAAFECSCDVAGCTPQFGASACVGPLVPGPKGVPWALDPARTTLAIGADSGDGYDWTASVPKLLAFRDELHVYWTRVQQNSSGFVALTSRGVRLVESPGANAKLWAEGSVGQPLGAQNGGDQVWDVDPSDPRSNLSADMQGVFTDGQHVFALAGLGGSADGRACTAPNVDNDGCYRLGVSRSFSPLGNDTFTNGERLANSSFCPTARATRG